MFAGFVALIRRLVAPAPRPLSLPMPQFGEGRPIAMSAAGGDPVGSVPAVAFPPAASVNVPSRIGTGNARRSRIHEAFDTSMPVANRSGLAGRADELDRLLEAVIEHRKHAIIFGARGSGKTSLSRVFGDIADQAGCVVLYNLASGDIGFDDLCRPYLAEMVGEPGDDLRRSDIEPFMSRPFDARQLASLFAERVRRPTILVLDEFDRVQSAQTKAELAGLMKLLSDMRSSVRIVTVGIAANVEDLIEGHPSLRRHMVSVAVGAIGNDKLERLLGQCCARAGLEITPAAASTIVRAAVGSPYHLRLFGLHAALQTDLDGGTIIDEAEARSGLNAAFAEWRRLSERTADLLIANVRGPSTLAFGIAVTCFTAALKTRVDPVAIDRELRESDLSQDAVAADQAIGVLRPILQPSAITGQYIFEDALAPQFYLLMFNGKVDVRDEDRETRSELRSLLQDGVLGR